MVVKYGRRLIYYFHHWHTSPKNVKLQLPQKKTAERTIYSSTRSYQIYRQKTMLRSVLWSETFQLTKMCTGNFHQSAWYQVFTVIVHLRGPLWKCHWEQSRPRNKMLTLVSTREIGLRLLSTIVSLLHKRMNQPPSLLPTKPTYRQFQNTDGTIHGDLDVTGNHDIFTNLNC